MGRYAIIFLFVWGLCTPLIIKLNYSSPLTICTLSVSIVYVVLAAFDHNRQTLSLNFSTEVSLESINCSQQQFTYQDTREFPTFKIVPTYPGKCFQLDTDTIEFQLNLADDLIITRDLSTLFSAFLVWGDELGPKIASGGRYFDSIIEDNTPPSIIEFDLDLNQGLLTIFFDSLVVKIDSLDVFQLTPYFLAGSAELPSTQRYILSGGTAVSGDGTALCIQFDRINFRDTAPEVCMDTASCYFGIFIYGQIRDMWGQLAISAVDLYKV